jgi:hypothetical protein
MGIGRGAWGVGREPYFGFWIWDLGLKTWATKVFRRAEKKYYRVSHPL